MNIPQTQKELQKHFTEQINFLQASCDAYDEGNYHEGKRIAAVLRTLFHDTEKSFSLTQQLGIKDKKILSTCANMFSSDIPQKGLIYVSLWATSSRTYYVPLDNVWTTRFVDFDDWWNEIVIIDQIKNSFSRKDLVLNISNKDGGVHIDPHLDSRYVDLTRKNSLGTMMEINGIWEAIESPELASMRQIGHEILKTYIKNYKKQPLDRGSGLIIGNMQLS